MMKELAGIQGPSSAWHTVGAELMVNILPGVPSLWDLSTPGG